LGIAWMKSRFTFRTPANVLSAQVVSTFAAAHFGFARFCVHVKILRVPLACASVLFRAASLALRLGYAVPKMRSPASPRPGRM
jgi:hypothetical protein